MKNEGKKIEKNGSGGHFVFQNEAKNHESHAFVDINLLCKFGEFMFINKGGTKPFVKRDERTHRRTDRHRPFYNVPSRAYRLAGDNKVPNCEKFGLKFLVKQLLTRL